MEELDLKQLMSIIWRKKIAIVLVVLSFAVIGAVYSYKYVQPMYKSTSTIILGKVISSNNTAIGYDINYPDNSDMISQSDLSLNSSLIETYSELVKSKTLIEEVKNNLKLDIETENLMKAISVSRVNTSDLLEVTAIDQNPEIAKQIVAEVVRIFSDNVKEIYSISNVYIIDAANIPNEPYNVNHFKDIIVFILIGLFLSLSYILLYNIIDNTVKSSYDIENILKLKTLITIPLSKKNKEELITVKESKSIISEAFRTLRTNVQFSNINSKEQKTLLITSCLPEEGKSYVSANLAITFAQAGKKVILVDSDMRRGRQAKIFNISNKDGLSNYISNIDNDGMELNWPLDKYIKKTSINNLKLITAGNIPPNPAELLESNRVVELIEELKKSYDIIIFDGAPLLPITDSLLLARLLGKTMLVAVHNKTKKDNLLKAKNNIENVGGKVIGVCLNKVSEGASEYNDNYYYYSSQAKEPDALEKIKIGFKNIINKLRTLHKRLSDNNLEHKKIVEEKNREKQIQKLKEEEEKTKKQAEKAIEQAKLAAEKEKRNAELAEKRAEEAKIKEAEKIIKDAAKKKKEEENKEKFNKKVEETKKNINEFKAKFIEKCSIKKQEFSEWFAIKKEETAKKYEEYRIKKEERKLELEKERERIQAEIAKKKEEERLIKETEKQKREEEKAIEQARIEEERAIKQAKLAEEKEKQAEEKAKRDAELAKKKEEEKERRETEKLKQAEEKAKREAEIAEQKARKEAENLRIREEEKERRAREKEDAKYTDEYLEDNLYPKTKYNKF